MSEQRAVFRLQRLGLRGARFETSPFSDPSLRPCSSSHDIPVKQDDGSPQTVEELRRRYASADLPAGSTRFLLDGVNHVALVSSDMRRTCDFYGGVLGLRLVKTIQLPGGGQHFFFDTGRGSLLAFFWWPQLQPGSPGVTQVSPQRLLRTGDFRTAIGTMNHVAWNVGYERLRSYRQILFKAGVLVSPILHHTDDPAAHPPGFAERRDAPGVYMSSIYFWGPDGEYLELIAQHSAFHPEKDVEHLPEGAAQLEEPRRPGRPGFDDDDD